MAVCADVTTDNLPNLVLFQVLIRVAVNLLFPAKNEMLVCRRPEQLTINSPAHCLLLLPIG